MDADAGFTPIGHGVYRLTIRREFDYIDGTVDIRVQCAVRPPQSAPSIHGNPP
jgi:hypothetical protein